MSNEDSTILKILTFEDSEGNIVLQPELDETATLLFERRDKYATLEQIEAALQAGIYGG